MTVQSNYVEMPRVLFLHRSVRGKTQTQVRKRRIVSVRKFLAPALESICFAQLMDADGSSNVRHVVFESRRNNAVEPGRSLGGIAVKSISVYSMQTHHATP